MLNFTLFTSKITLSIVLLLLFYSFNVHANSAKKPDLQHAKNYKAVKNISEYWLSEKLDGIRGYWDGKQLLTRQGNIIHSPAWFTRYWPKTPMDGELWLGRDQFQATASCVSKVYIKEGCWRKVRFMIFDLPQHKARFTIRIKAMKALIKKANSPYLAMIKQFKVSNTEQLNKQLTQITNNKGEGLMLHRGDAYYYVGRTANIMKLKKSQDGEARVIAHINGKGKYQGMMGAVVVKTNDGITFKIGSGFSDAQRENPPAIGTIISYKYNGKTQAGIPRFARFFRIREAYKQSL